MDEKYFYSVIEEFKNKNLFDVEQTKYIDNFFKFFAVKYRFMCAEEASEQVIDRFLFMRLPKIIRDSENNEIKEYIDLINTFSDYFKENYNVDVGKRTEADAAEVKRLSRINDELGRFLNNPVLSYSPLVIDIQRYKNKKMKSANNSFFDMRDKGYFIVEDIFSNNSVVLKKMYTGRFIKVILDKNLISWIRPKDILYTSVRQSPFFSWELVDVFKYYPSVVMDYVKKEAVR